MDYNWNAWHDGARHVLHLGPRRICKMVVATSMVRKAERGLIWEAHLKVLILIGLLIMFLVILFNTGNLILPLATVEAS